MMLKRSLMAAAAVCVLASAPAHAAVSISAVPGTNPYSGPAPTYDFEGGGANGGAPVTGGSVVNTGNSIGAQPWPFASPANHYWTVGPVGASNTGPAILNLTSFAGIASLSFIWGSVDTYNTLDVLASDMTTVLASYTGLDVAPPANGNQTSPNTNPLVTLTFSGTDQGNIGGLRLTSTTQAFETDNFAVTAVPEPGTWAMMLLGFGMIGFSLRKRKANRGTARLRVSFDGSPRLA